MPQNFIGCDRDQELLLPPNPREWLPSEHLAWLVHSRTNALDLAFLALRVEELERGRHRPLLELAQIAQHNLESLAVTAQVVRGVVVERAPRPQHLQAVGAQVLDREPQLRRAGLSSP